MWPTSLGRHLSDLIHQHRQGVKRKGWEMERIASGDHHAAAACVRSGRTSDPNRPEEIAGAMDS